MAEFVIKAADERGHLLQQVERGYSESEIRDRFVQQGYLVYWVKPRGFFSAGQMSFSRGRKIGQRLGRFDAADVRCEDAGARCFFEWRGG